MSIYSLDRTALLKIILHSLKFPTTPVSGFLIGEEKISVPPSSSTPDSPRAAAPRKTLHIYEAVPVTHNFLTLTMPLEAALVQLEQQCKLEGNVRIVGYYQCNERMEDSELGEVGRRIATRVETAFPGSVALVLDGRALEGLLKGGSAASTAPFKLLHKDGARGWIHASSTGPEAKFTCPTGGVANLLASYVAEGRHQKIADFEEHLENVEVDWLNKGLLD